MTIIIAGSWVYILNMVIATPWGNQIPPLLKWRCKCGYICTLKTQTVRCLLVQVVVNIVAVVFVVLFSCFPTVVVVDAVAAAVVVDCRRINLLVKSEALMVEIRRQFCDDVKYMHFNCFSRLKFCLKLRVAQTL